MGNFPTTQTVDGTVNVGNLPATQAVKGTVNVGNLPTGTNGNLNVNVVGGSSTAPPAATKVIHPFRILNHGEVVDVPINMKVTYMMIQGCDRYRFYLSGPVADNRFDVTTSGNITFPVPMDVTTLRIFNESLTNGCEDLSFIMGY